MLKWFLRRKISGMERRYGYDATYMHELMDLGGSAYLRFFMIQSLGGNYHGGTPRDAWFAAGIAGALVEDCGPCVQIASDIAMEQGMKAEVISALLSGKPTDADAQLGFDYGRALLIGSDNLDELRHTIEAKWGRRALVAMTLRTMTARNFPVIKRAMGHAKTCQRVRIGNAEIAVDPALKAA